MQSITSLLIVRFFHGIGFGMATTATGAIVADLIPESRKGEGMGYYGSWYGSWTFFRVNYYASRRNKSIVLH
ncbi:MFS transporter [Bacillus sp. sid0103]|uniref:MFS transporter n=1 Tax=Bacillus sp. sid0103 TaxID=2856337 RepID=UPI0035B18C7B